MSKQWPTRVALAAIVATALSINAPAYAQGEPVNTLTIGPTDTGEQPFQVNVYMLSAKGGPLHLNAAALPADAFVKVRVESADPAMAGQAGPGVPFQSRLSSAQPEATVLLPGNGAYRLYVTRFMADGRHGHGAPVTVSGPGLTAASLNVPVIELRNLEPGQGVSASLTVQAGIRHDNPARFLELQVDDGPISANVLKPDGSAGSYTIDPATLTEGLHTLWADAAAKEADNLGVTARSFVVDRTDSFTDVPRGYWGRTPIELLADAGVVNGRGAGKFAPEEPVTREEFAKMLALADGLKAPATGGAEFADVPAGPNAWSRPHVQALAAAGLIKGEQVDGVSYFRPQRLITRAEAATIVGRSLGVSESTVSAGASAFTDFADVPVWAKASVIMLARVQWLNGFVDGTFRPSGLLTRAQAAKLLAQPLII